nr:xanthine dehydrogenase-like [Leptinotarsa decemlineata]
MKKFNESYSRCKEVILFVNGELCRADVRTLSPTTTLNTYLREYLNLTGTKRLCLEGGCGTCVVSVSKRNPVTQSYEVVAVNSCLVSIFSCYGWEVTTIEGIGNSDQPHPLQSAITTFNGTQCGYCTPGMIMNMFALTKSDEQLTEEKVENSFGGNICRCTGYRSILAAFRSTLENPIGEVSYPDIEDIYKCDRAQCFPSCVASNSPVYYEPEGICWIRVFKYGDLLQILKYFQNENRTYMLVAGNTAKGVFKSDPEPSVYVDIQNVAELRQYELKKESGLILGANMSLASVMKLCDELSVTNTKFAYLKKVSQHFDWIANTPVRNLATLAGNLMMKHYHHELSSDIFLILETLRATLTIVDTSDKETVVGPSEFLAINMDYKVIKKITLPPLNETYHYDSFKIMPRAQNASALVSAGFLFQITKKLEVASAIIVYGGINTEFVHATKTEIYLKGKMLFDNDILQAAFATLDGEIIPSYSPPSSQPSFRKKLAIALFYKYILSIAPENLVSARNHSGKGGLIRPLSTGLQSFETKKNIYPVSAPVTKIESVYQTTGEAAYLSDIPNYPGQLHAAFVLSKATPNSKIVKIDPKFALNMCGVIAFFDKNDIPGKNTFTPFEAGLFATHPVEEELFCDGIIKYYSQPVGIIVATSREIAEKAADLVAVTYEKGKEKPYFNIRQVLEDNATDRIIQDIIKEPERTGDDIVHIIQGKCDVNWQFHFHTETQYCNAVYKEDTLDLYPTTQWLDLSQSAAAAILNIPANRINVSVKRLGGAFGAKIVRNAMIAGAAALASFKLKKPVKIWLPFETNMRIVGKRSPLYSDYEVATNAKGVIQNMKNMIYADHGQGGNEDTMFLLFEIMATYNTETWYENSSYVSTNMPSSCYTRSPGNSFHFSVLTKFLFRDDSLAIYETEINVSVKRLGGAFGAKIVRNAMIAGAAALASFKLKKPVKIWLPFETNMRIVGKRSPLYSDYEVATNAKGVIQNMKNMIYADHGQGGNEDTMFLLFEIMATYNTETWYENSSYVSTNMPSSCYTRSPGALEGFTMLEAIMEHTAVAIGMDPLEFRIRNISKTDPRIMDYINEMKIWAEIDERKLQIEQFNKNNRWKKKGISVVPLIYPIPLFFSYSVILSIYHSDGSVAISHGGVEIGQGINTKAIQVVAYKLGIPMDKITVKPSNNLSSANSHMTGASITSESVCWALIKACDILLSRMKPIKDKMVDPTWEKIVEECYKNHIHLTATSMNSPLDPELGNYVAYCVCASEIELDVLTGQHQISRVDILEDVGYSLNPLIDMGQVEGAFIMGVGYGTTEEIVIGQNGEMLTNRSWNYKPPGAKDIPIDFRIKFPGNNPNPIGVLHSKTVGEPPICLSVTVPLAIRQAVASVRAEADVDAPRWYPIHGPSTVENTFVNCLHDYSQYTL